MKWKTIKKFLPIIGIALFVYLIIKLDVVNIIKEIKEINIFYLIVVIFLTGIFFIFQPLKWFILAKKQKIKISFRDAFRINLISNFYGFVTPGKLGAVIRVNYLKKRGADTGKGLSNFIIDKVLDIISLFIFAIILGILFYKEILPKNYFFLLGILFMIVMVFFGIFCKKENSRKILGFVYRKFIPQKFKEKSRSLFNSFYEDFPSFSFLLLCSLINLSVWVFDYFIIYLIGLSLGISINFVYFLVILSISTLVAQIPITINGFGTRELTLIGLFGLFNIDAVKVFSMSVLGMIIISIIPALFAVLFILMERKNEIYNIRKSR